MSHRSRIKNVAFTVKGAIRPDGSKILLITAIIMRFVTLSGTMPGTSSFDTFDLDLLPCFLPLEKSNFAVKWMLSLDLFQCFARTVCSFSENVLVASSLSGPSADAVTQSFISNPARSSTSWISLFLFYQWYHEHMHYYVSSGRKVAFTGSWSAAAAFQNKGLLCSIVFYE